MVEKGRLGLLPISLGAVLLVLLALPGRPQALEKIKIATSARTHPLYFLPMVAGEEKKIWKEQNLEVDWIPFEGGGRVEQSLAAGAVEAGISTAPNIIRGAAFGLPALIVADMRAIQRWFFWVRNDSPIKGSQDLRQVKVGIPRMGVPNHIFAQAVGKALGLEKEFKFIAVGGTPQQMAALRVGLVEVVVRSSWTMMELEIQGVVRRVLNVMEYLPREWMDLIFVVHKDWADRNPERASRAVRGLLRACDLVMNEPGWAIEKMMALARYPEPVARELFKEIKYSSDGRIERKPLENVANFLLFYGLVPKDKPLSLEALYSNRFLSSR